MRRPYLLFKRGYVWYYRPAGEETFHTKGQRSRNKAEAYVGSFSVAAKGIKTNAT
jgi:hypothetical protein